MSANTNCRTDVMLTTITVLCSYNLILRDLGLQTLAPQAVNLSFEELWAVASNKVAGQEQKGLNSIIILGAWSLWNHRNRCVFDGSSLSLTSVVATIKEEARQWSIAGTRGVSHLLALAAPAT